MKALGDAFLAGLGLGQWGHGDGVVVNNGGLDELGADEVLDNLVNELGPVLLGVGLHLQRAHPVPQSVGSRVFNEVDAAVLLDGVAQGEAFPGGLKI
ncbi:hypothetical protein ES708_33058 [subsurface metagenome]